MRCPNLLLEIGHYACYGSARRTHTQCLNTVASAEYGLHRPLQTGAGGLWAACFVCFGAKSLTSAALLGDVHRSRWRHPSGTRDSWPDRQWRPTANGCPRSGCYSFGARLQHAAAREREHTKFLHRTCGQRRRDAHLRQRCVQTPWQQYPERPGRTSNSLAFAGVSSFFSVAFEKSALMHPVWSSRRC